ncbi:MAG TPA: transketolase family protein, partial [Spirochaetes bacterium]|nr:transketolase family protein [Spirochaetota bacterium]
MAKASRVSFGEAIAKLGEKHPEIVVLEADLGKSTYSYQFGERFPERYFEMGIAEANMIGTGAGLAMTGKIAFICSFAAFVTGRYDIIRMSIAYPNVNVRIIGTHCGVAIGPDGN